MGLKGLVSVLYKSKFLCNVYLNHHRISSEWNLKGLLYLFEIYSKYNHLILIFPMSFGETCATMQSVFTCYTVSDKTNGTVIETWILLLFYISLGQRNNQIKCKTKYKHKEVPRPLQSHLNTTCECRYWSEMAFAFTYYVATCIFVIFYSFNVIGSNRHIFMTFICSRTYSVRFN